MALTRPKLDNINTTLSRFADPVLTINSANSSQHDAGFIIDRSGIGRDPVGLIWDSTNQTFKFAITTSNGVADGNITIKSLVDVEFGNVNGNLNLANAIIDSSVTVTRYSPDGPDLNFYSARGTKDLPTAVQVGDPVFNIFANARNNTGDETVAQVVSQSTGTDASNLTIKLSDGSQLINSAIFTPTGVEIPGNLFVRGSTTTISTEQLTIQDNNIIIAANATTPAEADGSGFTFNGANIGITYSAADDYLTTNINVAFTNNLTVANSIITSNAFLNSIQFDSNTNSNVNLGEISWNLSESTLSVGSLDNYKINVGQDTFFKVRANSSIDLGQLVCYDGFQDDKLLVKPVDSTDENFLPEWILGFAVKSMSVGVDGLVINNGKFKNFNTSLYDAGTPLYYEPGTQGLITDVVPVAPNHKIKVAFVLKQDSLGIINVRITRNPSISELQDVYTANVIIGNYLYYSNNNRWEAIPLKISDDATPILGGNLDANGFTITNVASITVTGNIDANYFVGNIDFGNY